MISALYVLKNGPYFIPGVDPWDEERDARKFKGPGPVIAHPPCQRWGRYWGGGPMLAGTTKQKILGDDDGCFAHALWSVRTFGGLLEHPEASHAFRFYGLPIPKQSGGWTEIDKYGGRSCCVAQGKYEHKAQKLTWIYAKIKNYPELRWGKTPGRGYRLDEGFHSKEERRRIVKKQGVYNRLNRLNRLEKLTTPNEFRNLLIKLAQADEGECRK